jgi:toxin CcdB
MRFLDVCRNPEAEGTPSHPVPFLLVVQGNHVEVQSSRVVVPLVRASDTGKPIKRLMPVFTIEGEQFVMMTPQIAGIATADIGTAVASLADHRFEIRTAIDILTGDL